MVLKKAIGFFLKGKDIREMGIGIKADNLVEFASIKRIEILMDEGKKLLLTIFFLGDGNHLLRCIHAENLALAKKGELLADDSCSTSKIKKSISFSYLTGGKKVVDQGFVMLSSFIPGRSHPVKEITYLIHMLPPKKSLSEEIFWNPP